MPEKSLTLIQDHPKFRLTLEIKDADAAKLLNDGAIAEASRDLLLTYLEGDILLNVSMIAATIVNLPIGLQCRRLRELYHDTVTDLCRQARDKPRT